MLPLNQNCQENIIMLTKGLLIKSFKTCFIYTCIKWLLATYPICIFLRQLWNCNERVSIATPFSDAAMVGDVRYSPCVRWGRQTIRDVGRYAGRLPCQRSYVVWDQMQGLHGDKLWRVPGSPGPTCSGQTGVLGRGVSNGMYLQQDKYDTVIDSCRSYNM